MPVSAKKQAYFEKLNNLVDTYSKVLLVTADNIGSNHLQQIRRELGEQGRILMGKNTMIRKCLREKLEDKPELENLIPFVKGNVGFVFTNEDLKKVRDLLLGNRVEAPAKAGTIAPNSVTVPAGPTGMEPTQTSFLQALNIASKIVRGQVEIVNDVELIVAGTKVGSSEAALLQRLGIKPFSYGLSVDTVYDNGAIYDADVLDLTEEVIIGKFFAGVNNIASISLEIGFPTVASLPHSLANGFKNLLAISLETDYSFEAAEKFQAAAASGGGGGGGGAASGGDAGGAAEPEPEPEPEEESEDEDLGGGLFGDDDGW